MPLVGSNPGVKLLDMLEPSMLVTTLFALEAKFDWERGFAPVSIEIASLNSFGFYSVLFFL